MKKERTLFLVVLFAACQAVAQQQTQSPGVPLTSQISAASASRTNAPASAVFAAPKPKFHLFGPSTSAQPQKNLRLIEGLDPRAWTTVAETRTSRSAFPSGETHEAGLCLLWWGSEPRAQ
jgi:hypothetical protein